MKLGSSTFTLEAWIHKINQDTIKIDFNAQVMKLCTILAAAKLN